MHSLTQRLSKFTGAKAFFAVAFINAFVDLGHKILIQNTLFKLYDGPEQVVLTSILNALILLPFIMLLSPAGFISDRFKKVWVIRRLAWGVLLFSGVICISYFLGWFKLAFAMTFLLAVQSSIYSPAKYGLIKTLFGKSRLGEANGVVSSLSIIAILTGMLCFSLLFELSFDSSATEPGEVLKSIAPAGILLVLAATAELIFSYCLPLDASEPVTAVSPKQTLAWRKVFSLHATKGALEPLIKSRQIRLAVIGLSTFWAVGQVMLAAFPAFIKAQTGVDNTIAVQGVLACSGIGIAMGSFISGRISRNHIELGVLPFAAIGLATSLLYLPHVESLTAAAFIFFTVGLSGGIFIVPLNALIQFQTDDHKLGKTLAANNWLQNVTMLSFLAVTAGFSYWGYSSKALLQIVAGVATIGAAYTLIQLPRSFLRIAVSVIMRRHYKLDIEGLKNIPSEGGALLLGNHISWIDWAIIQIAVPRPVRFVMINSIYNKWYLKWMFKLFRCIPISQGAASRTALQNISEYVNNGELVCLFPEGTISRTGHLVAFRKGFERCCENIHHNIPIVPFYLHGLWGSQFSRSAQAKNRIEKTGNKRNIVVSFGNAIAKTTAATELKQVIHTLSINSWHSAIEQEKAIGASWVHAAKNASNSMFLSDAQSGSLNAIQALSGSLLISRFIKPKLTGNNIGILLPSSTAGALSNLAVLLEGKTIVNINYSASIENIRSALNQAEITSIISSRKFISKLKQKGIDLTDVLGGVNLIALEDMQESTGTLRKIFTFIQCKILPASIIERLYCTNTNASNTAAILFSSGSEGSPKGVCLSHKNIIANVKQTTAVLNPDENDAIMANLPLFHAFGLSATMFMPLLECIPVAFHADPTDALGAAKSIARHRVTVLFGTSTFLRLFIQNRKVHPLMLETIRLVVAGAEKLKPEVRQTFNEKFNKAIYEGYGATEASPVISVNMPDRIGVKNLDIQVGQKQGSVGQPLPGTSVRIVDPVTYEAMPVGEAGLILIAGVQIMNGYLNNEIKTEEAIKIIDHQRWYVSGDKGYLDTDGFLFIVDRYSRFAKIGGEMVSLTQVEDAIEHILTSQLHTQEGTHDLPNICAVNLPHAKKGEQIILLSTAAIENLLNVEALSQAGLAKIAQPSEVLHVEIIPTLASGKLDIQHCKVLAQDFLSRR